MLLSGQQIKSRLANRTCRHSFDCQLTEHCQTTCDHDTGRCSTTLLRPTLSHVCKIVQDYLYVDAPRKIKKRFGKWLHNCYNLGRDSARPSVSHSIVVIELKRVIWDLIQNAKLWFFFFVLWSCVMSWPSGKLTFECQKIDIFFKKIAKNFNFFEKIKQIFGNFFEKKS